MARSQPPDPSPQPPLPRIGVDTGGTFTDLVLVDPDGRITATHKLLSTPDDPARAVLEGIDTLLAKANQPSRRDQPVDVVHGSTVATNALLEHASSRAAFITTAGFEDTLRLARQHRPDLYDLQPHRPPPPIPRDRCLGVRERLRHDGRVDVPLDNREVQRIVDALADLDVEAVAVSLLHSYANDTHERQLGKAIRHRFGDALHLTLSCDLLPEFREYERASTCVINAVVAPRMRRYLTRLVGELGQDRLRIMASHGGTITAAEAIREPIRMILSGPAGGVLGASHPDEKRITLDMGGTSTDVALLDGGPTLSSEHEAGDAAGGGGWPVHLPMVDIHTVGAGGGSIAWLDPGGALRVGPQSAGADPGPACYGRQMGNPIATVTDAHVFLGHLPDHAPLGDGMHIQRPLAVAAIEHLAKQANLSPQDTAQGILRIAEVHMARAVQRISLQRGHDPRRYTLTPFGGAGGLHACRLAAQLGMRRVIVPPSPGLLSAVGMLTAPPRRSVTRSLHQTINPGEPEPDLAALFADMSDAHGELGSQQLHRTAGLRYVGQSFELTLDLDEAATRHGSATEAFHHQHEALYGYANRDRPIEWVVLRAWIDGPRPLLMNAPASEDKSPQAPANADSVTATLIPRITLPPATPLTGPITITEYSATTLVPAGWTLHVQPDGALLLEHPDA